MKATREQVVRFLLEAQGLVKHGRTDPLAEIRRLECVQIDPVAAVERNQHLVLSARIPSYRPESLDALLAAGKTFEYFSNAAMVMPMEDYPIFAGSRRRYTKGIAKYLAPLGDIPNEIRAVLRDRGPQPARAFESAHRVRGWWDTKGPRTKATSHALGLLLYSGEVMVVRREGSTRFFDLAEHAVPRALFDAGERMPTEEADALLFAKYCRGLRIFDTGDPHFGWRRPFPVAERKKALAHDSLVQLAIVGVKRPYWMLESDIESLERKRRTPSESLARFLPPLDNLMWHRRRLEDLFGFEYRWEVYTPAHRRRYGYYTMPILFGDQLIGRFDPTLDRERHRLVVHGLYLEPGIRVTDRLRLVLRRSLVLFARWHGATEVRLSRTVPRTLKAALSLGLMLAAMLAGARTLRAQALPMSRQEALEAAGSDDLLNGRLKWSTLGDSAMMLRWLALAEQPRFMRTFLKLADPRLPMSKSDVFSYASLGLIRLAEFPEARERLIALSQPDVPLKYRQNLVRMLVFRNSVPAREVLRAMNMDDLGPFLRQQAESTLALPAKP